MERAIPASQRVDETGLADAARAMNEDRVEVVPVRVSCPYRDPQQPVLRSEVEILGESSPLGYLDKG
jgi:hypothetical protein